MSAQAITWQEWDELLEERLKLAIAEAVRRDNERAKAYAWWKAEQRQTGPARADLASWEDRYKQWKGEKV